jgi:hypothetical protein
MHEKAPLMIETQKEDVMINKKKKKKKYQQLFFFFFFQYVRIHGENTLIGKANAHI